MNFTVVKLVYSVLIYKDGWLFIEMHKDMFLIKYLLATVSSSEFNTMSLNSKLSKVVSYIQDNKAWEMICIVLELISLVFRYFVLHILTQQGWTMFSTHLKSYGVNQTEKMKRKIKLILIFQNVVIQICWKYWVL